jgi:hypothetical protein
MDLRGVGAAGGHAANLRQPAAAAPSLSKMRLALGQPFPSSNHPNPPNCSLKSFSHVPTGAEPLHPPTSLQVAYAEDPPAVDAVCVCVLWVGGGGRCLGIGTELLRIEIL